MARKGGERREEGRWRDGRGVRKWEEGGGEVGRDGGTNGLVTRPLAWHTSQTALQRSSVGNTL